MFEEQTETFFILLILNKKFKSIREEHLTMQEFCAFVVEAVKKQLVTRWVEQVTITTR